MINNNSSYRTLIECINHFVSECPINGTIDVKINSGKVELSLMMNERIIFKIDDAKNLQMAYEALLEWIIEKSDIANR